MTGDAGEEKTMETQEKGTPEKKRTGKTVLKVFMVVLLCAVSAAGGFIANGYYTRYRQSLIVPEPICTVEGHIPAGEVQVRIDGGDVQWFDGQRWTTAASEETLAGEDRYQLARENYAAFEEKLLTRRETEGQTAPETGAGTGENAKNEETGQSAETAAETGEETGESAETPVTSRVQLPETGQKVIPWRGGGSTGGGSGGGGGGAPSGGGSGGGGSDGQDIEWSGDYL